MLVISCGVPDCDRLIEVEWIDGNLVEEPHGWFRGQCEVGMCEGQVWFCPEHTELICDGKAPDNHIPCHRYILEYGLAKTETGDHTSDTTSGH